MKRVPLHPLLFAAWPVLLLYAANMGEVDPADTVRPLVAVVLGAALLVGIGTFALRSVRRAALAVSVVVVALLTYGHVENLAGERAWLPFAWAGGALVLAGLGALVRRNLDEATTMANGVAGILLALSVVSIATGATPVVALPVDGVLDWDGPRSLRWEDDGPPRDVYYLVLDRYGSQASFDAALGVDNSAFLDRLEARGFDVLPDVTANHLRTAHSLASSLNLEYLHELSDRYGPDSGDFAPLYDLIDDHRAGRLLQSAGYRYVHIGSWWDPTATSDIADVELGYRGDGSDFSQALLDMTLLAALPEDAGVAPTSLRVHNRSAALAQFPQVANAGGGWQPTFTFAHILLPHEPYVFDADGSLVTEDQERARTLSENFAAQLTYTNTQLDELLDHLLDRPADEQPIVILQGDEGPHPVRTIGGNRQFDWTQATDAELVEKLAVLNAWYVPEGADPPLHDELSPVNNFRVLFNTWFGTDFPLLPDETYIFRDESHAYDFSEVTDRLR